MDEAMVERKNSLFTGTNLRQNQTQEGWPSAFTGLGVERTGKREQQAPQHQAGKHKLMTRIMSYVH